MTVKQNRTYEVTQIINERRPCCIYVYSVLSSFLLSVNVNNKNININNSYILCDFKTLFLTEWERISLSV
jgi:hypothetical protein